MSVALAQRCGDVQATAAQGICEGCFRTIDEIVSWGTLPDVQRLTVWQSLQQRAVQAGCQPPELPQAGFPNTTALPKHVDR